MSEANIVSDPELTSGTDTARITAVSEALAEPQTVADPTSRSDAHSIAGAEIMTEPHAVTDPDPSNDTWVIIPLFNEEKVISAVVQQVHTAFAQVVCVDDGSSDRSADVAAKAGARVVRHPLNLGQGAALQTGFEYALTDPSMKYIVTFDADGQHQIADAVGMVDRLRAGEADVVFGSRFLDERSKPGFGKKMVLRAAVGYTNLTTHTRLTDAHNGLRAISRPVLENLKITQNRMAHATELVAQIGESKARYVEHPVHILYSDYSRAKGQSLWNSINILADLILR